MRAITVSHLQSAASFEGEIPPRQASRNIARLVTSELTPSTVVISAHGEIDASNADDLRAGVRHALGRHHGVIIDLTAVKFFGTEGLSVLDEINGALEQPRRMAVVPSSAVTRVLRLCTPSCTLVTAFDVDAALAAMQSQLRPVLHLVAEAH
jgi:anti-anti-sigma factor